MTATPTRIIALDIIRGVAVMGILSVNIVDFAMNQAAYLNPMALGRASSGDLVVWAVNMLLVDGKFRSLFSMLFGASMLLVIDRAEAAGQSGPATHLRRMAALLLIGLVHAILIWRGDILTLYAMAGIVATMFARSSLARMLLWAGMLAIMHIVLFSAITATIVHQDLVAHSGQGSAAIIADWNANAGSLYPTAAGIIADRRIYDGGWLGIVAHQWSNAAGIVSNNLALLPDTLALMLLGMASYRSGFFTGAWDRLLYRRVAVWGMGIGLAGHAALVVADLATGFYVPVVLGGMLAAMVPFRFAQALGYAALIILCAHKGGPLAKRVAAVGRAAFSNYLGTSIVCTAIFYGWGLGLYDDLSRLEAWLVVPIVWLLMLAWSKPWLDRFRYGPLEWLWRSIARGALQPMRQNPLPGKGGQGQP